jgi:hypothetical protein
MPTAEQNGTPSHTRPECAKNGAWLVEWIRLNRARGERWVEGLVQGLLEKTLRDALVSRGPLCCATESLTTCETTQNTSVRRQEKPIDS